MTCSLSLDFSGTPTMKRILICLDGTWNSSGATAAPSATNVARLYQNAIKSNTASQVAFYSEGVGTRFFEKIRGGLFGYGLYEQIKDGYHHIMDVYKPGDQIIITGFSRGAFSARCLASFVAECGILKEEKKSLFSFGDQRTVDHLWDLYKNRQSDPAALRNFCSQNCHPPTDTMVGAVAVWDTVGALGVPWEIFGASKIADKAQEHENERLGFLDLKLSTRIARGYHAVALDEQRVPFQPTLWDDPRVATGQILQVWFAGAHSNVGGGFGDRGLSDISLDWMIRQLRKNHGLILEPVLPDPEGIWDPVGITGMDTKAAKLDGNIVDTQKPREVPPNSLLHPSAELRKKGNPPRRAAIPTTAIIRHPYTVSEN
jgi:uncharacterized protein (DUF2235 family)